MMPPPSLTADMLKKSERSRAKQSENAYYNPSKTYYAPYGSHNNSEYASQSSDTGCTSDAASFTTETTDNEDPRHFKRRNKVILYCQHRFELFEHQISLNNECLNTD